MTAQVLESTPEVIALFGPTGVGKTAVALELADILRRRGEDPVAISADALQVYAGLETLTGVAGAPERARLEHRLVSFVAISEPYSVGQYMPLAHAEIDAALSAGRRPLVVGGTGLYLRAALAQLDLRPPPAPAARERIERELATRGPLALHVELRARAPLVADRVEPTDSSRLVRALELAESGRLERAPEPSQLWAPEMRRPTLLVGLEMERSALYARIDARVERMVAEGAGEEVRRAHEAGASRTARKALGFEELLAGDVEAMKRRTRRYAKRQLTWMRKLAGVHVLDVTDLRPADVAARVAALL